jgi:hypothetical protein
MRERRKLCTDVSEIPSENLVACWEIENKVE